MVHCCLYQWSSKQHELRTVNSSIHYATLSFTMHDKLTGQITEQDLLYIGDEYTLLFYVLLHENACRLSVAFSAQYTVLYCNLLPKLNIVSSSEFKLNYFIVR